MAANFLPLNIDSAFDRSFPTSQTDMSEGVTDVEHQLSNVEQEDREQDTRLDHKSGM